MSSTLSLLQYNHNIIKTETEETLSEMTETLSNALDVDLSNISETGKEYISPISLPSGTYKTLTLGSSGATYTAPADGWVNFGKTTGSTSSTYLQIKDETKGYLVEGRAYGSSTGVPVILLPVSAGDTFSVTYTTSGSTGIFRFYYAHGAV